MKSVKLFKPSSFSPVLAFIGIILLLTGKRGKRRDTGTILLGFAVLMAGMEAMSAAVKPLANVPEFTGILTLFSNPLLGVLAGALLTGIIQSSSASVGILQALSVTGMIPYSAAIPIILGQNIGTCITALLSSIGTNKNARRAAIVHLYFNLIGTTVFLLLFYGLHALIQFSFVGLSISTFGVALVHSGFNILSTLLLLPFAPHLEKLARLTIRDSQEQEELLLLDTRLFNSPSIAIERCRNLTINMAVIARDALFRSLLLLDQYSEKEANEIQEAEDKVDLYEDKLGAYLVQLSGSNLSQEYGREASKLLHSIGDIERISDHAVNIMQAGEEMHEKKIVFSPEAQEELKVMRTAIREILSLTVDSFSQNDAVLAGQVEPLEEVVDFLKTEIRRRHVLRLQSGCCTIELGFVLADLLTNMERVADHCSNIAVNVIELEQGSFETHEYLSSVKDGSNADFTGLYQSYLEKYSL